MSRRPRPLCLTTVAALATAMLLPTLGGTSAHAAEGPTCDGLAATIVGTPKSDTIRGTRGADVIVGLGGRDLIDGGPGNDVICGGDGRDWLWGDRGGDRVFDRAGSRGRIHGGPGADRLRMTSPDAERSMLVGGPGDDLLVTTATYQASFTNEAGQDTVRVRRATKIYLHLQRSPVAVRWDGRAGTLTGQGRAIFHTRPGSRWVVNGSQHADVLLGTDRGDSVTGGGGRDLIRGRRGNDTLGGFAGADRVSGGRGNDTVFSIGRDVKIGGPGRDALFFGRSDRVYGGRGNDLLSGRISPGSHGVLDAGGGHNTLRVGIRKSSTTPVWAHVLLDLRRHLLVADGRRAHVRGPFSRVLVIPKHARTWTVNGTSGDDDLEVAWNPKRSKTTVLHGRAGDDLLLTDAADDQIFGGDGQDLVYAGDGVDTCTSVEGPFPSHASTGCEVVQP